MQWLRQGHGRKSDQSRPDKDIRSQVWSTLSKVHQKSAFAFSTSSASLPNPGLYLPDHGVIGLPLSQHDARIITSKAKQSPFGKKEATVVDTNVRKSWELDAKEFQLKNPEWDNSMNTIVSAVAMGLGLNSGAQNIKADLYKLLLYEPGAFFKPHKDSEKQPGMFGTLIVCLPSSHEGGKIVLTHGSEKHGFETAHSSEFNTSFAAWYADITHEVLPVTSGNRLVLTYNLIRQSAQNETILSAADIRGNAQQLLLLLKQYDTQLGRGDLESPPFLAYKLKHQYTQASLSSAVLKGRDASHVEALRQIADNLDFDVYLTSVELEITRDEEYSEDGEEIDRTLSLNAVSTLDGEVVVSEILCEDDVFINPKPLDEGECDDEEHSGWTGNEGQTATYWYRDTAVILVPPSRKMDFLFESDPAKVKIVPLLDELDKEGSLDESKKLQLMRICALAVKDSISQFLPISIYTYKDRSQRGAELPELFSRAATVALRHNFYDIFDEAATKSFGRVILDNASLIGRLIAQSGMASMKNRLIRGVEAASTPAVKYKYLKDVEAGSQSKLSNPHPKGRQELQEWIDNALLDAFQDPDKLTKSDANALAELSTRVSWSRYEPKAKSLLVSATTTMKTAYIVSLLSVLPDDLEEHHDLFLQFVIENIWLDFAFDDALLPEQEPEIWHGLPRHKIQSWSPATSIERPSLTDNLLTTEEIISLVECTSQYPTSLTHSQDPISAILAAVPEAPKRIVEFTFLDLVRAILENRFPGIELSDADEHAPQLHKALVQSLIVRYTQINVGNEPVSPKNWSLSPKKCTRYGCGDCKVVNDFLRDPKRETLDFPAVKHRRQHLDSSFGYARNMYYDVENLSLGKTPHTWRITKHQREHQNAVQDWRDRVQTATATLKDLPKDEASRTRLEKYLDPYRNVIMEVKVDQLPKLDGKTLLGETSGNSGSLRKRTSAQFDAPVDGPSKRTRSNTENDEPDTADGGSNEEVEVIDLTDL